MIARAARIAPVALLVAQCAPHMTNYAAEALQKGQAQVGQTRWITTSVRLCDDPGAMKGCENISAGSLRILEATTDGLASLSYKVLSDSGRVGYISDFSYISTESSAAHDKRVAERQDCKRRGGVRVGMTAPQVLASCWGRPDQVNKTVTANGAAEQWVYGSEYVYIDRGIVTAIQTSR